MLGCSTGLQCLELDLRGENMERMRRGCYLYFEEVIIAMKHSCYYLGKELGPVMISPSLFFCNGPNVGCFELTTNKRYIYL